MHSYSKDLYYNSVHTIGTSLIVATVASFLYMLFVQCLPKAMNRVAVVLGIVAIIALAVCFIVYPSRIGSETRLVVFFLTVLFLLIILCTFAKNFRSWGLNGIFLEYSTKFVCARLYVLVLPFVFLFLMAAFLFCQLLQYRSFWSNGELKFEPETELYHKVESPTSNIILSVLQVIQIYWGIVFLKEACTIIPYFSQLHHLC
jgi:predicted membrane channel-forming protein YqfA (hemolysin III family)